MEILKASDLTFTYAGASSPALENINISLSEGELVLLCGASGCGKSTLLRRFKSAVAPRGTSSGEIFFCGRPLGSVSFREQSEQIGYVGQSPENQTVTDKVWHELAFGPESLGLDSAEIRARVAETAAFFGLGDVFGAPVCELSGGRKQLLNIASVMVMRPKLLLLDEPAGRLDPYAAASLFSVIARINRELGTTVLLAAHCLDGLIEYCDRMLFMENGRIICDGEAGDVVERLASADSPSSVSLPEAARIWAMSPHGSERCPVTVAQGREWLSRRRDLHLSVDLASVRPASPVRDTPSVEAEDISFSYQSARAPVISSLSLKLYPGEVFAVMGGNGVGKSTLLSLLAGINTPDGGSIRLAGRAGYMPEDPLALFVHGSVYDDLCSAALESGAEDSRSAAAAAEKALAVCSLGNAAHRHPYDLSGGEAQRAALAYVLVDDPDILLLDEPTKGLDALSCRAFGNVLRELASRGKTVVIVSHDARFCAEYADRCALMDGGRIVYENDSRTFFRHSVFGAPPAVRIARGILPGAVTAEEIAAACGGKVRSGQDGVPEYRPAAAASPERDDIPKIRSRARGIVVAFAAVIALLALLGALGVISLPLPGIASYVLLALSLFMFAFASGRPPASADVPDTDIGAGRSGGRSAVAAVILLVAVPATVCAGAFADGGRKYLLFSLLLLAECLAAFFASFEHSRPGPRYLVTVAVLCAIGVAGRGAFYMLPQFKPVAAVTIVAGAALGGHTGFLVGAVSMLASNMLFGQGPWTLWQMAAMGIIGMLSGLMFYGRRLRAERGIMCVFGFLSVLAIYGTLMNLSSALLAQESLTLPLLLAYMAAGLPMDAVHALSTASFLFLISRPMLEKLERMKTKYGVGYRR